MKISAVIELQAGYRAYNSFFHVNKALVMYVCLNFNIEKRIPGLDLKGM